MQVDENIQQVLTVLKHCRSILFITGAGVSADSGLPTYRGVGGLYNEDTTEDGIPIEMALAGEMLEKKPEVTWKYLSQIEQRCRSARYNRAHEVIAEMERCFKRVWVLTQNIDGFHQQAGSRSVIDIHGDMHVLRCSRCEWQTRVNDYSAIAIPPVCPDCGAIVRPDVVFFGEMLPIEKCQRLQEELTTGFDAYFSIGTTSVFPYIREPILHAKTMNRPTIEINPGNTEVSSIVDIKVEQGAAAALDTIGHLYQESRSN